MSHPDINSNKVTITQLLLWQANCLNCIVAAERFGIVHSNPVCFILCAVLEWKLMDSALHGSVAGRSYTAVWCLSPLHSVIKQPSSQDSQCHCCQIIKTPPPTAPRSQPSHAGGDILTKTPRKKPQDVLLHYLLNTLITWIAFHLTTFYWR